MPTTYLQLLNGAATGDALSAANWNKAAGAQDRLAQVPYNLLGAGVFSGWTLTSGASTVAAGAGLVGTCWCVTAAVQAVSGLLNTSTNYVYARTDAGSPASGTLDFVARATSAGVTNYDATTPALYLGKAHYVAATGLHTIVTTNRDAWGIDHGGLLGLTDDDHPDYMQAHEVHLPASQAVLLGTSAAATSTYGTNQAETLVKFANGSSLRAAWTLPCPADYSGTITIYTDWVSSGTGGNTRVEYLVRHPASAASFDGTLSSACAAQTVAISGTAGHLRRTSVLWSSSKPTAGDRCVVVIRREGANTSDTCSGVVRLAGLKIKFATAR